MRDWNLDAVWSDLHGYTIVIQQALANDIAMLNLSAESDSAANQEA